MNFTLIKKFWVPTLVLLVSVIAGVSIVNAQGGGGGPGLIIGCGGGSCVNFNFCNVCNSCGQCNLGTDFGFGCTGTPPDESGCSVYSQAAYYSEATYYSQSAYYSQSSYLPGYSEGAYYAQSSYYSQGTYAPGCGTASSTLTSSATRVASGTPVTLTFTATGVTTSCTISGPGVSLTIPASSCGVTRTIVTPPVTSQFVYNAFCDAGLAPSRVIINVAPKFLEF